MSSTEGEIITSEPEERSLEERFQSNEPLYIINVSSRFDMVSCYELREMEFFLPVKMSVISVILHVLDLKFLWQLVNRASTLTLTGSTG